MAHASTFRWQHGRGYRNQGEMNEESWYESSNQ